MKKTTVKSQCTWLNTNTFQLGLFFGIFFYNLILACYFFFGWKKNYLYIVFLILYELNISWFDIPQFIH